MISSLLSRYMIEKITMQPMPMINPKKCINQLQKRQSCQLCQTFCPHQAIEFNPVVSIKKEACQNCGICSSICPTGTMIQPLDVIQKQYHAINKGHDVVISCEKNQEHTDLKVGCLTVLPWEFFAYIAIDQKVKLITRHCATCEKQDCANQINLIQERVKTFLQDEHYEQHVSLAKEVVEVSQAHYSRRELLKLWTEESKRLMTEVAPIKFEANQNARIYRSLLIKKLQRTQDHEYGWCGIKVNQNCYGCGICETVCPQKAITITSNEENQRLFQHHYLKCTHCGLCQTVCLEQAVEPVIMFKDTTSLYSETTVSSHVCSVCQDPMKPEEGDTCILCEREQQSTY